MSEFQKLPDEFTPLNDEYGSIQIIENEDEPEIKLKKNRKRIMSLFLNGFVGMSVLLYSSTFIPSIDDTNINDSIEREDVISSSIDNSKDSKIIDEVIETQEVIKESQVQTVIVECDECNGTGIICPGAPEFGYDRGNGYGYEGCHGTGFSPCPDIWCVNGIRTCQGCKGSGLDQNGVSCEICDGDGIDDCEFCHGTGIAECISMNDHYTCIKCEGTGQVEEKVSVDSN